MTSQIDPSIPVTGTPTTQSVRNNFATAQTEISTLQDRTAGAPFLRLAGGIMAGPMYLFNDPTDSMMPATKGYVDAQGGGGGGGGGIPEAPATGEIFGRGAGAWQEVLSILGGTLQGPLLLADDPDEPLGAATKQYVDAVEMIATAALPRIGGTLTGPLILADDPTDPLGAVTKRYTDTGLALKAPIANPVFTGPVNASGNRLIVTGTSAPSLTLRDTTATQQTYGIYHANNLLNFGLTDASGTPSGSAFATMDSTGAFLFATRLTVTSGRLVSRLNGNSPALALHNQSQDHVFGLWNDGSLQFGFTDPNGVPQTPFASFDAAGELFITGTLWVNGLPIWNGEGSLNFGASMTTGGHITAGGVSTAGLLSAGIAEINLGIRYPGIGGVNVFAFLWMTGDPNLYLDGTNVGWWQLTPSDERLKSNLAPVNRDCLAAINAIELQQFDMRTTVEGDEPRHWDVGYIAQQVREVMPDAVRSCDDGPLGVDLRSLCAHLIGAVQQLTKMYEIR